MDDYNSNIKNKLNDFPLYTEITNTVSTQKYPPEGERLTTAANISAMSSLAALQTACEKGVILEGVATLCDNNLNLSVDLGIMNGTIRREEVAYLCPGESLKDIAVISRVGRAICFKILGFYHDEDGQLTARLSRKAAQSECLKKRLLSLLPGDIIPARVTHLEPFGAFVDIGCGVISLLPIDAISVSRISHPSERFVIGDNIRIVIKELDADSCRIYVTHKELLGTWEENASKFAVGQTVTGIIRSVEDYGIFIELAPNLAGLAEYKSDIVAGGRIAVYIKNIICERMKVKLVMLGEPSAVQNLQAQRKKSGSKYPIEYFIPEDVVKIESWQYSPPTCNKLVETEFVQK